jgi:alpha-glucan,water dikinase
MTSLDFLRYSLGMLGKGNGDGQKIRDEILVIIHRHHIKETNDHFYEQWHQKLHNNTTPDDIDICQAVIDYLKSGGNINIYWETLKKAGITRERLANFERKIVAEPYYNPNLIQDFENFLHILKSVHSSDDLIMMFNGAKIHLGNDYGAIEDIIKNDNHWDSLKQMSRISFGREKLNNVIRCNKDTNKLRDLLFLDLALENQLRKLVEKIIHVNLQFENYIDEINFILRNILLNFSSYSELKKTANDWFNVVDPLKNIFIENKFPQDKMRENVLKIKSISDRLLRCLSHVIDFFSTYVDKKAKYLGNEFKVDEFIVSLFTEEIIRGSVFFALSMVLKKLDPFLRKAADLGNWKVISPAPSNKKNLNGNFDFVKNLKDVQFKTYPKNTILLTEYVGGNEEVPINVDCLIIMNSNDYPDTLAHVSVRVRNMGIPLVVCFEDSISEELKKNVGKFGYVKFLSSENITFGVNKNDLEDKMRTEDGERLNSKLILRKIKNYILLPIFYY